MTPPVEIEVSYIHHSPATRKLYEDEMIREVQRALTAWFYTTVLGGPIRNPQWEKAGR